MAALQERNRFPLFLALFLLVFLTCHLQLAMAAPAAKTVELSLAMQVGAQHGRWVKVLKPWADEIEKRTGGRVKIVPYFSNLLFPSAKAYDSTVAGIADITENAPTATPGRFPALEVICLSPIGKFSERASRAYWEYYKAFPEVQTQFSKVKVLWLHSIPPQSPMTVKKDMPKDAKAYWDEAGKFDKYFSAGPGEGD